MASYRVGVPEPHANGNVHLDTWVIVDIDDGEGGTVPKETDHFTVVISALDVLALAPLTKDQRVQGYLALFIADPRVTGITAAEAAVAQMKADVNFPTAPIEVV